MLPSTHTNSIMVLSHGCGKCSLPIGGGLVERVVCDGCCKEYHLICTQMNSYQLRVCVEFKNVIWLCDDCLLTFRKQQPLTSNESNVKQGEGIELGRKIEHTVSQLQSEITTLKQCFAELQLSLNSQTTDDSINNAMLPTSTPRGSFNQGRTSSLDTNECSELLKGSNVEPTSRGCRKFWIYFTRVAKHVSVDVMREMVASSLKTHDSPDVIKLLPRWGNYDNLKYISFKVGVDWKHREKAVLESTWPAGLLFREFVHRESYYWEP